MDLDERFSLLFTHLSCFFWSRPSDGLPPHLAEDLLLQLGLNSAGRVRQMVWAWNRDIRCATPSNRTEKMMLASSWQRSTFKQLYDSFRNDHPVVFTASKQIQYLLSLLILIFLLFISFLLYSEFDTLQKSVCHSFYSTKLTWLKCNQC